MPAEWWRTKRNGESEWHPVSKMLQSKFSQSSKNRKKFCLLPISCCFAGRNYVDRNNYLQDENLANNNQLLYPEYGHIRSFVANLNFSVESYRDVWRLLVFQWWTKAGFLPIDVVHTVICLLPCVYWEPGPDRSGSIWSCRLSLSSSIHRFKAVSLLHPLYLGSCKCLGLPNFPRLQVCWIHRKISEL